jgi:Aromatic-ring-opening dioxygenase LigAB, LigA subunit
MSRYSVDKVMRSVITNPQAKESFLDRREEFLAAFELADDERRALTGDDLTALYLMGAHPFLIVGFGGAIMPPAERHARMTAYQKSLVGLGYPDYGT